MPIAGRWAGSAGFAGTATYYELLYHLTRHAHA
jgi:hypothetical protein